MADAGVPRTACRVHRLGSGLMPGLSAAWQPPAEHVAQGPGLMRWNPLTCSNQMDSMCLFQHHPDLLLGFFLVTARMDRTPMVGDF